MKFKLRKFKKGDEISLQKNINDKEITKNTLFIPFPYTKKSANFWIKHNLKIEKERKSDELNFVIDINDEVAGSIGFNKIDWQNKKAEIGFWLAKKYWGRGIMTKAIKEITKIGFNKLKLDRLYAYVFTFNKASARALEKAGYELEGRLRKNSIKNGKHYDDFVYAKVK